MRSWGPILVIMLLSIHLANVSSEPVSRTPRPVSLPCPPIDHTAPIHVDNDVELDAMAVLKGWPGDGSEGDPYRIENMEFGPLYRTAIYIGNTTKHVVLDNCTFNGTMIHFHEISNISVEGCVVNLTIMPGIDYALYFEVGWNIDISNCTLLGSGNFAGVYLNHVYDLNFSKITIKGFQYGVLVQAVERALFSDNSYRCQSKGLDLYYCDRVRIIGDLFINIEGKGASVFASDNVDILNCSFFGNPYGVYFDRSTYSDVNGSYFLDCPYGFYIKQSTTHHINVTENEFKNSSLYLGSWSVEWIRIRGNMIHGFTRGDLTPGQPVLAANGPYGRVEDNTFIGAPVAMELGSDFKVVSNNTIKNCGIGIRQEGRDFVIVNNTIEVTECAIELSQTSVEIYNNNMTGGGLGYKTMRAFLPISQNNTVNGKPFYFLNNTDMKGKSIGVDPGQVYLSQVTNLDLTGLDLDRATDAIGLYDCNHINISDSRITNGSYGIRGKYGNLISVRDCDLKNQTYCILTENVNDLMVKNTKMRISEYGVLVSGGDDPVLTSNTMSSVEYGIYVYSSYYPVIKENKISARYMGVQTELESLIENNTIWSNLTNKYGIVVCDECSIYDNIMWGCGIYLEDQYRGFFSDIPQNNSVNGKRVLKIESVDMAGIKVPSDIGQLILRSVSNAKVSDLTINNATAGIQAYRCNRLAIDNCTLLGQEYGLVSIRTDGLTVKDSRIGQCFKGVYVYTGWRSNIHDNEIFDAEFGIEVESAPEFGICYNTISGISDMGISIKWDAGDGRNNSKVSYNTISNCGGTCISVYSCWYVSITHNVLKNSNNGIRIEEVNDHIINDNTITDMEGKGISGEANNRINVCWNSISRCHDDAISFINGGGGTHIIRNNVIDRAGGGIYERDVFELIMTNNTFTKGGLFIDYRGMGRNFNIPDNNTVDGKPLLFLQDVNLGEDILEGEYGQILLFDVSFLKIIDMELSDTYAGILGYNCKYILIEACTFIDDVYGLKMQYSTDIHLSHNEFVRCTYGAQLHNYGYENKYISPVANNLFMNCDDYGLDVRTYLHDVYLIHNNSFVNNRQEPVFQPQEGSSQAFDQHGNNVWNTSGGKGNYWDEHEPVDSNYDGIPDNPYKIDRSELGSTAKDHFPMPNRHPSRPRELKAHNSLGSPNINLWWTYPWFTGDVDYGKCYFHIYRGTSPDNMVLIDAIEYIDAPTYTDITDKEEGRYYYCVTAYNFQGESYRSNIVYVDVDILAPRVEILSPLQGQGINTSYVNVRINITDTNEVTTKLKLDDYSWVNIGNRTEYTYYGLLQGLRNIQLQSYDRYHNTFEAEVSFYIDYTGPDLNVSLLGPSRQFTNREEIEVEVRLKDAYSKINKLEYSLDGGPWNELDYPGIYRSDHQIPVGSDGYHSIDFRAFDELGNFRYDTLNFIRDREEPELTARAPKDGDVIDSPVLIANWTATDILSGIDKVVVDVDGLQWEMGATWGNTLIGDLEPGEHLLILTAYDRAGNYNITRIDFLVDLEVPTVEILEPRNNSYLKGPGVNITWNGTDGDGSLVEYLISIDGGEWIDVGSAHFFVRAELPYGTHTARVRAVDISGKYAEDSVTFTLDWVPPVVISHYPKGDDVQTHVYGWVFFSEEMDPESIDIRCALYVEDVRLVSGRNLTFSLPMLAPGTMVGIEVAGRDLAGNPVLHSWSFTTTMKGTITGRIVDENGNPIEGASVYCSADMNRVTDDHGEFILKVDMGPGRIEVSKPGYETGMFDFDVGAGEIYDMGNLVIVKIDEGEDEGSHLPVIFVVIVIFVIVAALLALMFYVARKKETGVRWEE